MDSASTASSAILIFLGVAVAFVTESLMLFNA